jgi:SAM-dependent methyltransferase
MYIKIKKVIKSIFPQNIIIQNELFIRKIYSLFYYGNIYKCNICNCNLRQFVKNERNDLVCPNCGSLNRDRKLWHIINENYLPNANTILDFSPSRCFNRKMKSLKNINYFSTDLSGNFLADYKYDITKIDCETEKFDLIICYHILEHIIEDLKAMKELHRVLKKNGVLVIQTPFKDGEIYEDSLIKSENDRLLHFGQEDHVRIYSKTGLKTRLESISFEVNVINFKEKNNNTNGFLELETVLICSKI